MEFLTTITAVATGFPAATATIRLSGALTRTLLDACFISTEKAAHRVLRVGRVNLDGVCDTATAVFFESPFSYTGEDMAEITIHGSPLLAERLLLFLIKNGATAAAAGEFSRRAFLNGKLDLSAAEGVLALINAESEGELKSAFTQLTGGLGSAVTELQEDAKTAAAALEVLLDFPEEDIEEDAVVSVAIELRRLGLEAKRLADTYRDGRLVKQGVRVAIVGGVNVGKSSLLNALLKKERAIVTDIPGTTRDTLEDRFEFRGQRFVIVDTAGIRATVDEVESIGIKRSQAAAESGDVVLAVVEAGQGLPDAVAELLSDMEEKVLVVENKTDIMQGVRDDSVKVSALRGEGMDALKDAIYRKAFGISEEASARNKSAHLAGHNGVILTELRHFEAINEAADILLNLAENIFVTPPDCLAADLMCAYNLLGKVTGQTGSDAIIDEIFSRFCVGK